MTTTALIKEGCGTHFVHDQGELERHVKMGWTKRPADWKAQAQAESKARRLEALKAQQEKLASEQAELESALESAPVEVPERKKPGRPKGV